MQTLAKLPLPAKPGLAPDAFDRVLAGAALVLIAAVLAALLRGRRDWASVPPFVWLHLVAIASALALTPAVLLRRRGDRRHRLLGWAWCLSMFVAAAASFGIRGIRDGGFSPIHVLSALTLVQLPLIVGFARTHRHARHRVMVRATVAGALIIAGAFTFPFDRLLGRWLFG